MFSHKVFLAFALVMSAAVSTTVAVDSDAAIMNLMPMTAVPRWGSNACWGDGGGFFTNNCGSTKTISFMTTLAAQSSGTTLVPASFVNGVTTGTLCQQVWMSADETAWGVGPQTGSGGFGTINMSGQGFSVAYGRSYSIDCSLGAGFRLGMAEIFY